MRPAETPPAAAILDAVFQLIQERQLTRPAGSYVVHLLEGGVDRTARKVGEEALEVVLAAKNGEQAPLAAELADLWFHTLVLLAQCGLTPADVYQELAARYGKPSRFARQTAHAPPAPDEEPQ